MKYFIRPGFVFIVMIIVYIVYQIMSGPFIGISVEQTEQVTFRLATERVYGILLFSLRSKSRNEMIWEIKCDDFRGKEIIFGELPGNSKQLFPEEGGKPRRIDAGEEVAIEVRIQYDHLFDACVGSKYFYYKSPKGNANILTKTI